jgi:hypothetical protein
VLATGAFPPRGDESDVSAVVQLTGRGSRLSGRRGGVLATVSLTGGFAPERVAWTIRLKR